MFEYKKIAVIGCSGAGKSTFSRKLTKLTGLPLHYLDMMYWKEDCSHISRDEFIEMQKRIIQNDRWIIDGNFRNTLELRIQSAELVFFFDLPVRVCIDGVLTRGERPDMPCILPADDELLDSIKDFNSSCKPEILDLLEKYKQCEVVTFKSRVQADKYLEKL